MSQKQDILDFLELHGSITPLQAIRELGCTRLAARIYDIEQTGTHIPRKTIQVGTRNGKATVTQYQRPVVQRELLL